VPRLSAGIGMTIHFDPETRRHRLLKPGACAALALVALAVFAARDGSDEAPLGPEIAPALAPVTGLLREIARCASPDCRSLPAAPAVSTTSRSRVADETPSNALPQAPVTPAPAASQPATQEERELRESQPDGSC
jgi:hypothetical protein